MRLARILLLLPAFLISSILPLNAQWKPRNPVTAVQQQADGVVLTMGTGTLRIQVCSDSIVHVLYSPTKDFPSRPEYVVVKQSWPAVDWKREDNGDKVQLSTARLRIAVDRTDGSIAYSSADGKPLMNEANRMMRPVQVNGENTYHAESLVSMYGSQEGLYGLGQHQAGVWNYRGESVDISQENTNIAVPFMVSSRGYGLFWNNDSRSRFNDRFLHYLYISSEVADVIDYYFFYGPELDKLIADYRELTGRAPMFGKWAYGFWQCKNRYKTQDELLGVAAKYRELKIPVDNIVQDWFWWVRKGEFVFNRNYPDPKAMIDELHRENFHLMISVWPFFEPGSSEYDYMNKQGWFIDKFKFAKPPFHADGMAVYDASNHEARKYYWSLLDKGLFKLGVDAWWMDTTEPETEGQEENIQLGHKLAIGSGDRYVNLFPLMTTSAVYQGQRQASSDKRVFILSRSAFAGSQRNAVTAWSGDVNSTFLSFKRQIPAGLNFALSGIPYWTTDIGGFVDGNPDDPQYRELFIRWFQYGTFCPIFRVHGTRTTNQNELWSYGPEAQQILTSFDNLRYRLMPYIYSLAWQVTHNSYTIMRPLVMDFPSDQRAINVGDQFMFGPAIMVNPVTEPGATMRHLYLPKAKWYDFWTGATQDGGVAIDSPAPLDKLPLYVRAGSILPMGPEVQYASEKPADPIEIRIYPGANADFAIYEDENDNYDYEKGEYAVIPLHWNDSTGTLTIGDRTGSFPGMMSARSFQIVLVREGHGTGEASISAPDKTVQYSGKQVAVPVR
ncbi:MAG TPA: glycoside hydrolase family 31 protein [Terriglobales bacterium]|nr:glycoside hydrolase family 31 protein [Terriglobales bacterium]